MIRIEGSLCYCGARAAFGVFYFSQLFVFFTDRYYYQKFAQKLKMFLYSSEKIYQLDQLAMSQDQQSSERLMARAGDAVWNALQQIRPFKRILITFIIDTIPSAWIYSSTWILNTKNQSLSCCVDNNVLEKLLNVLSNMKINQKQFNSLSYKLV